MKAKDIMKDELKKDVERIIERINAELPDHLAVPFDLEIVENGTREPMGFYTVATKTEKAVVSVNCDARDTWGAARHELGHHVWESYLADADRVEWGKKIWQGGSHISEYAQTNPIEGFAEAFMLYFQERDYLPLTVKQFIER